MGWQGDEDRRQSPGRRAHDNVLQVIWRELDEMKKDMRRYLNELREDLEKDTSRLDEALKKLEERLQGRVSDLEEFHITERAKAGEKIAERASTAVRWQKVSIAFGVVGTCMGIVAVLVTLLR